MAVNSLAIHLTDDGINALNEIMSNGQIFNISKVELSSNIIPATNPNDWFPDGGTGLPYYVQTTQTVVLKSPQDDMFLMDMELGLELPLAQTYNPLTQINGWVGAVATFIEVGSFALFLYNPATATDIPFCIGYFNNEPVQKYAQTLTNDGNILQMFNNLELKPTQPSTVNYQVDEVVHAQFTYISAIASLPISVVLNANAYSVGDIYAVAYAVAGAWRFTNYSTLATGLAIDSISGSTITSAALYNALPTDIQAPSQLFANNLLLGQIVDSLGVMKKCFIIQSNAGNVFTANTALPALQSGDTLQAFILFNYTTGDINYMPVVETLAATSITSSGMQLNGNLVQLGSEFLVRCYFEYRQVGQSVWNTTSYTDTGTYQSFNQAITGLTTATTYEFRASVDGLSSQIDTVYGSILTATTS